VRLLNIDNCFVIV